MAKKDKKSKKDGKSAAADPVEAVRSAVERTFQVTSEGAAGTRERTRELVDEVAGAAARIRQTIEDLRVLEDLRKEVDALSKRVDALEAAGKATTRARRTAAASSKSSGSGTTARPAAAKTRSTASRAKSSETKSAGTARSTSGGS